MSQKKQSASPHTVNLTQAAKLAEISRSTLHRDIKKGKISKQFDGKGSPIIAIVELERVYGGLQQRHSSDTVSKKQPASPNEDSAIQVEVKFLREQVSDLKSERDRLLDVIEEQGRTVRMLTDQRQQKPRGFWERLTGKGQI